MPATAQSYTATFDRTPLPTGLVGAWGFNEGAGTTVADASGNGNDGTLTGAGRHLERGRQVRRRRCRSTARRAT